MTDLILKTYTLLKAHRMTALLGGMVLTLLMVLSVAGLHYKEDIADFLPVDSRQHDALKVYQDIAGAGKVFAVVQHRDTARHATPDADLLVAAADHFAACVQAADTSRMLAAMTAQVDMEQMTGVADFVYANIPYFLTEADYRRMDSLLCRPDYVPAQLKADKQMLMFPTGGLLADNIQRDPLNLFTPVVQQLQGNGSQLHYEMYDGHIFSPDMTRAIVMMDSPYGASETEHNARLTDMLRACADSTEARHPEVAVHIIGGPVIAVGNARQIKHDSLLAVGISVTLILALLIFSLRHVRNLLLIVLSIGWGWLFAMAGLALLHDSVSVIVIGISSVILGIAVNYPLHFIAHLSHTPDRRKALSEIVMPLLVGNVTTVGAFLALVPLQSVALRDLGLFSSLLLVGTIVFVLLALPHLARTSREAPPATFIDRLSRIRLENKPALVAVVAVLTVVLGYFSLQTTFDANMSHINYMTDEQKADMAYFQRTMAPGGTSQKVYAVCQDTTLDAALDKSQRLQPALEALVRSGQVQQVASCSRFIVSQAEQQRRLARWHAFWQRHAQPLQHRLRAAMQAEGFADASFDDFMALLQRPWQPQPTSYFAPLSQTVFAANLSSDSEGGRYSVVSVLSVADDRVADVETRLPATDSTYCFDVASMNSAIANHLSDDFNYIGLACGCIVFFFLWLSMGSIELAVLSFVPMAVSWLWILGIMALCGMQFNIVNVILATFIFGQGDDYTIFMTEGSMYEYAYRRKMLASYKHSIILSALIMFVGIGTLVVARHPALRSLAEVTIAGMFSVVLMAYIFPPLIFRWLVQSRDGHYRRRPLTLPAVARLVWAWLCGGRLARVPGVQVLVDDGRERPTAVPAVVRVCQPAAPLHPLARRWLRRQGIVTSVEEAVGLARERQALLQPVVVHGLDLVVPADGMGVYRGTIVVSMLPALPAAETDSSALQQLMQAEYERLARREENARYFCELVLDRYRYKGTEVFGAVKRAVKKHGAYADRVDVAESGTAVVIHNDSLGEMALLYALVHPQQQVTVVEPDEERRALITYSAEIAGNLKCVEKL